MRYRTLDSVRGIAAFVVVLCHSLAVLPNAARSPDELLRNGFNDSMAWLYLTPLRLLVSGYSAVLIFFVLSGFVLTLTLNSAKRPTYPAFAVSRFARIWLPFAAAILMSAALCFFLASRPVPGTSGWFQAAWSGGATPKNIARHLAMTGTGIDLDSPMWSLVHELRISFILPVLVIGARRFGYLSAVLAGALIPLFIFVDGYAAPLSHLSSWMGTGIYIYFFMLGILLALNSEKAKELLSGLGPLWIGVLWAAALAGIAIVPGDLTHVVGLGNAPLLLMNGLAAALIIALSIVDGRAARILMSPVARYLGRISYSLYLLHLVVIVAVLHAVGGAWPLPLAIVTAIPLAIIAADISQRFIEAPSQRLGKAVAARIDGRRAAELQAQAPEPAF